MSGIGLFIDGAHLAILWRQISRANLDFYKLQSAIAQHCDDRIVEAYCFDATTNARITDYYAAMQRTGIRVKLYDFGLEDVVDEDHAPIVSRSGRPLKRRVQKGVDVGLATHMLDSHRRRQWSQLALVASDADFAEPVQRLVETYNVKLTLIGVPTLASHALRPYAGGSLDLRTIQTSIERYPTPVRIA